MSIKKIILATAALALLSGPAFAQYEAENEVLRAQIAATNEMLRQSLQSVPNPEVSRRMNEQKVYNAQRSINVYSSPYGRPNVTVGKPPVGNFNALNDHKGNRPSCMPYYWGCNLR